MTELRQAAYESFMLVTNAFRHTATAMLLMGLIFALPMVNKREVWMPSALSQSNHAQLWSEHSRCTEDMSCWNCSTMGNLICGRDV